MTRRKPFEIAGCSIPAGLRATVDLPVTVQSDHTPVNLSVHVIHGAKEGPTMFVSAGVHGDEVIGVEIVRRLLRVPSLNRLAGTLLVVPIVNSFGFLSHSRYLPDRRDLNRSFPGHPTGSLASRLAHIFLNDVVLRADLGIDLHSAAVHRTNLPQIRISPGNDRLMDLAKSFGAPVIMTSKLRDGSLRGVAKERGVDILLYEAGEGLRFDEMAVRTGVAGILRVMRDLGMIAKKGVPTAKTAPLMSLNSAWTRAPMGGLMRTFKRRGEMVSEGDVMGMISDPFGEKETEIIAESSGIIVGRAVMPVVNEGDAIYHIAQVKQTAAAEDTVELMHAELLAAPMFDEDEII
ncbi:MULTISPECIES: succinylglutamate desuccinylase/aspartoacylase family protein [Donghicola]|mgnify:CR=1 FL=1|jgi:predicted deacylase|nr:MULTISPECIES: succinylglutamate desuccinylase/aspartoacylase family protein [Donghicola]MCT4578323.1 succinylglutamate desuccinylase/aspartoacylase family protein [Donghicola sp.]